MSSRSLSEIKKRSESEIAALVVAHFEQCGWNVYQEVQPWRGGQIADLVCWQRPLLDIVEVKTRLSMDLLEQAIAWRSYAHHVWVAVPGTDLYGHRHVGLAVRCVCDTYGIGIIGVGTPTEWSSGIEIVIRPDMKRNVRTFEIVKALDDEHKAFCKAGTQNGSRWTPWVATCDRLRKYVEKNPGCEMRTVFNKIEHHYASVNSAKGSMSALLRRGIVPGIELRVENRKYVLYVKETDNDRGERAQVGS